VAKNRPLKRLTYSFIISTGKSIEAHLRKAHQLLKTPARNQTTDSQITGGQITIHKALGLSSNNGQHDYAFGQLQRLFDARNSELLLMNWIIMNNLPFQIVTSERFRRYLKSVNPVAEVPTRQIMVNLVIKKYQYAIPQVKAFLNTAKELIHLIFDIWTSRQNESYLGIHAYFVDKNWNPHIVLLKLQLFHEKQHNGSNIGDVMAYVLKFFEIKDRCVPFIIIPPYGVEAAKCISKGVSEVEKPGIRPVLSSSG
jgi:hypothetical protein